MLRLAWVAGLLVAVMAPAGGDEGEKATLGKKAPTFVLKDYAGKEYDLAEYKDKTVVLEWFNLQCPTCKMFESELKATAKKYAKKDIVWLAVDSTNFRSDEENADYAKEHGIKYPILSDFEGKVGRMYGAKVTPHVFIIHKGKLVYEGAFMDKQKKKAYVADALDELLADKPVSKESIKPFG